MTRCHGIKHSKYSEQYLTKLCLDYNLKYTPQAIFPTSPISALLPEFESDTVTTCDDLCDECDHQLTNLVGHNIKKFEKKIVQR